MKHFACLWVALSLCAVAATGCGLVLDTQPRGNSARDQGTGEGDLGTGLCVHATDCDDGNVCNGAEDCVEGQCVGTDFVLNCDDGIGCTDDVCDPFFGCGNLPNDALCGTAGFCFPEVGCASSRACDTPFDCGPRDPCLGAFDCIQNNCVLQEPVTCPDQGCLVGACRLGTCLYAPDSSRCGGGGCAVGSCSPEGVCSDFVEADDSLCDDGATCTIDTCLVEGNTGFCSYEVDLSPCEDGVECTFHACDPADDRAEEGTGCIIGFNDTFCADVNGTSECALPVCLPSGCDGGVKVQACIEGGACDVTTGFCEFSEGCPNNCADYGSPCAPAACVQSQCVTVTADPCVSTTPCMLGYCDVSGDVPSCALRPDPACGLSIQVPLPVP